MDAFVWCPIRSCLSTYTWYSGVFAFFERGNECMLLFDIQLVNFWVFLQFTELFAFFAFSEHLIVFSYLVHVLAFFSGTVLKHVEAC